MEKYVYFRTEATLTDDDDQTSSCLFPLSSFAGAYVVSTTLLCLTFEGMHEYKGGANGLMTIFSLPLLLTKAVLF